MQRQLSRIGIFMIIIMAASFSSVAQIYVTVRPSYQVVTRPVQPSVQYVWIDEEWQPRNGKYVYSGGRWVNPPKKSYMWQPGHWQRNGKRGERWTPGRWRKH